MRDAHKKLIVVHCFLVVVFCTSTGCRPKVIAHRYYVAKTDIEEDRSLYFKLENGDGIGRIEPRVVSVGWDDKYIIAKQQIKGKKELIYYILEIEKDHAYADPKESVIGPLSEPDYMLKRKQLNVSTNLIFSLNF